ncbi:MAG: cytidylate kinase-like family protein [Lachnospiraceae bacterium]|nr:cytidylate kinase-like family protein [Lachnospiraceae bacterium]
MNQIITIGREFGSGGKLVGQKLAERLNIKCYDKELLSIASKESGLCAEVFETHDEKPINSFFYSLVMDGGMGAKGFHSGYTEMPLNQKVFLAQFESIQNIARTESCIIVGRCADYALEAFENVTNVFICGDLEDKVERVSELYQISKEKSLDLITKTDKKRANYYNYYSNRKWGVASTYDLSLNSTRLGIDGCAEMILQFVNLSRQKKSSGK